MPPKFKANSFFFEQGQAVPEHIEDHPSEFEQDPSKFGLAGEDTFSQEPYPLAVNIDTLEVALALYAARHRELERTQPTVTSGGQGGIQDRVHIVWPRVSPHADTPEQTS